MNRGRLLIADDERNTRDAMVRFLRSEFAIDAADDGARAIELLKQNDYDLVLTDLRMPGADGLGVMEAALSKANPPECIVFTAYGSVEKAVEAVKAGAFDFITKPVKLDKLSEVVNSALAAHSKRAAAPVPGRDAGLKAGGAGDFLIGDSPAMKEIAELIRRVAPSRSTVLVTGESGTGKEVAARAIHALSLRKGLFVALHCAALPENLLESELFGHEKGAFTGAVERRRGRFELADGGTIFLDEIGEISPAIQVKLLRVLETRSFERIGSDETLKCDFRLVAATNRNLAAMVREGTFREDLYYRLNVVELKLPPLRERTCDIAPLAREFAAAFAAENGRENITFAPETLEKMRVYNWPGNIRELKNCVERLIVLCPDDVISPADLPENIRAAEDTADAPGTPGKASSPLDLEHSEREMIEKALRQCGNNRTAAAAALGISRRTLQRRLKEYLMED